VSSIPRISFGSPLRSSPSVRGVRTGMSCSNGSSKIVTNPASMTTNVLPVRFGVREAPTLASPSRPQAWGRASIERRGGVGGVDAGERRRSAVRGDRCIPCPVSMGASPRVPANRPTLARPHAWGRDGAARVGASPQPRPANCRQPDGAKTCGTLPTAGRMLSPTSSYLSGCWLNVERFGIMPNVRRQHRSDVP
jgi:hypothetical protein